MKESVYWNDGSCMTNGRVGVIIIIIIIIIDIDRERNIRDTLKQKKYRKQKS